MQLKGLVPVLEPSARVWQEPGVSAQAGDFVAAAGWRRCHKGCLRLAGQTC